MAWRRIDGKPLTEPMLTWFIDTYYIRHLALGGDELIMFLNVGLTHYVDGLT